MPSIFLSHSWKDKIFTRELANNLAECGVQVWIDEAELKIGDSLITKISNAIKKTDYFAVILSKNSVSSPWVKKELVLAITLEIQNIKIKVLPIKIEECEMPDFLNDKLYADFTNSANYMNALTTILQAIGMEKIPSIDHLQKFYNQIKERKKYFINMKHACQIALQVDKSQIPTVEIKINTWNEFLNNFKFDNKYANYAQDRINYWQDISDLKNKNIDFKVNVNGIKFVMCYIPSGTFLMGADCGNEDEKPPHKVTLSDYFIGKYLVTQDVWEIVMGYNYSNFRGDNLPVENIRWSDCKKFIEKLNEMTTLKFRLPTEAEWEYAAKGGEEFKFAGSDKIKDFAWFSGNSEKITHPVGQKNPNKYGLYDMCGNVLEWCEDNYDKIYYKCSAEKNPLGTPKYTNRKVLRGGSWLYQSNRCYVFSRHSADPFHRSAYIGFRLVLVR